MSTEDIDDPISRNSLEELLASVFLWDVKGETTTHYLMEDVEVEAKVNYLKRHGYNVEPEKEYSTGLVLLKITRK